MTTPTPTAPPPPRQAGPAPASRPGPAAAAPSGRPRTWSRNNTPGWYRVFGAAAVGMLALLALIGFVGAFIMANSAADIRSNTAPSLIAVQGLSASLAEADSNATAAFLSAANGSEDRQRRVAYLDALRRSAEQTEDVAALIGDDEAGHRDLKDVAVALTGYSGSIEAARAEVAAGQTDAAVAELRNALDLSGGDIATAVASVTAANQDRYDDQAQAGALVTIAAIIVGLVTLALLVYLQSRTARLSNRVLNPGLVIASIAVLATVALTLTGFTTNQAALRNASDGGYDAIATTSRLQSSVNQVQAQLSLRLLGGSTEADIGEQLGSITADSEALLAGAESDRERAAAEALAVRLDRFEQSALETIALTDRGDTAGAVELFRGRGFADFNGVNTAIEAALSDNRTQFDEGVDAAAGAVSTLPWLALALPIVAALATVYGVQRRLRDYQ